ncbi:hypothetical protein J2X37_002603 [Croceicoccus sp. BE223]|nr:hypothetical protein [Croceicoccus sp. BE223]
MFNLDATVRLTRKDDLWQVAAMPRPLALHVTDRYRAKKC